MTSGACEALGCNLIAALGYTIEPASAWLTEATLSVSQKAAWLFPLVAGIAGASAASLSGLVVHRLPKMRGWHGVPDPSLTLSHPPSHCDSCGGRVPPAALVPGIGWFVTEGRCRDCGSKVPWIYPAVECAVGAASLVLVAAWGASLASLSLLILLWLLVFVSWIDWNEHEIPDLATIPMLFMGLLWTPFEPDMHSRIVGAAASGMLTWGAFRITKSVKDVDTMSLGDIYLAGALGAWLGICALPPFLLASCAAYLAYAIPLRRKGEMWVPMGPALCAGFVIVALTGLRSF